MRSYLQRPKETGGTELKPITVNITSYFSILLKVPPKIFHHLLMSCPSSYAGNAMLTHSAPLLKIILEGKKNIP